jgi:hypothetical protein
LVAENKEARVGGAVRGETGFNAQKQINPNPNRLRVPQRRELGSINANRESLQ